MHPYEYVALLLLLKQTKEVIYITDINLFIMQNMDKIPNAEKIGKAFKDKSTVWKNYPNNEQACNQTLRDWFNKNKHNLEFVNVESGTAHSRAKFTLKPEHEPKTTTKTITETVTTSTTGNVTTTTTTTTTTVTTN